MKLIFIELRGKLWESSMHLQRVQIPDFRALKNIDITFEKEFQPRIFPLGSQNGGGKSTLLQLIFVLLHCSVDSDKKHFLINMLENFHIYKGKDKRVLAIIDIWDGDRTVNLEFLSCKDDYIKLLEPNYKDEIVEGNDYKFSILDKVEDMRNQAVNLGNEAFEFDRVLNALERIRSDSSDPVCINRYLKQLSYQLNNVRLKRALDNSHGTRNSPDISHMIDVVNHMRNEYGEELRTLRYEIEGLDIILQRAREVMNSNNYMYLCNHSTEKNSGEVLLCHIDNIDMEESENFFKELSKKAFLAAPSTQVFLFLSRQSRNLLFQENDNEMNYSSQLKHAKLAMPGLFTYDFLSVDVLIEYFKMARDQDFKQAIHTGEYGNHYKDLLNDFKSMLLNKVVIPNEDLSGVTFKLDDGEEDQELYTEDLSHGELKRLSIYMWIKYRNIENAIVLMDEIEIAFHPDWQYQIVQELKEWAPSNQYILATHSYPLCEALTPAHVKEIEPKLLKQETLD